MDEPPGGRALTVPPDDPRSWQARLLAVILRIALGLGLLVYIPSLWISLREGLFGVALVDTAALFAVAALLFLPGLPYRWRAAGFCLTFYLLAVGLLVWVGPISQIYLFGATLLCTVLLGLRAGIVASVVGTFTMLVVGAVGWASPGMTAPAWNQANDLSAWVVITLNFALVNVLLTLAVGTVLRTLQTALSREIGTRVSLEHEHTLLRTLLDTLPDIVFTKDAAGRYVRANAAAVASAGLSTEAEMVGHTDAQLFGPERGDVYRVEDQRVLAGEPLRNREEHAAAADGTPRWLLTNKVPLRDSEGRVTGLIGVARDITDRKRAELERNRVLAQLQLQIARMPLAYLLLDADLRVAQWNPAAERMFGFTQAEMLGRSPFETIVPEDAHEDMTRYFAAMLQGAMDVNGDGPNLRKDGTRIRVEWHNTPLLDDHGRVTGILSLAQDVTARHDLEDQLRQSQKMEAVGRLAGGVAHDFNNLLTLIIGYSALLLGPPQEGVSLREAAQAIRDAGERAASLTRQLLGFSRQTLLQPRVLDLNTVVTAMDRLLQRLIGEDVQLTTRLAPSLRRVKVDPGQLDQVLMNLAVNARDAMPTGGHLTIGTADVWLDDSKAQALECRPGAYVMLSMTDSGCGMTEEVRSRIFDPFFTTKAPGTGTGLGLAMVFGIVRQSGGGIGVDSAVGKGSTFRLYLPAIEETPTPAGGPVAEAGRGGHETILVVEDEASVRQLVQGTLERQGYRVLPAGDAEEAHALARTHVGPVEMVLSDVVMPRMSGPELVRALQAIRPSLRALFMSGYTDDAVMRHGLAEADVAFIQKPFTPDALVRRVREVLDAADA